MKSACKIIRDGLAALTLAAAATTTAQAATVDVTVDGTDYTVDTIFGSFNNINTTNSDILTTQPWYSIGDGGDLAGEFAAAVGTDLGTPNQLGGGVFVGPIFAVFQSQAGAVFGKLFNPNGNIPFPQLPPDRPFTWAIATEVEADLNPIPLPPAAALLFGGLGVLTFVKRRRA